MGDAVNVRPLPLAENAARHKALGTEPDNRVQEAHLGVVAQVADVHRLGVAFVVVHEATQAARVALGGLDHEVVGQYVLLVHGADVEPPNLGHLHRTHHLFVGRMARCEAVVVLTWVSPEDTGDIREVAPARIADLQVLRVADALVDSKAKGLDELSVHVGASVAPLIRCSKACNAAWNGSCGGTFPPGEAHQSYAHLGGHNQPCSKVP